MWEIRFLKNDFECTIDVDAGHIRNTAVYLVPGSSVRREVLEWRELFNYSASANPIYIDIYILLYCIHMHRTVAATTSIVHFVCWTYVSTYVSSGA